MPHQESFKLTFKGDNNEKHVTEMWTYQQAHWEYA